MNSLIVYSGKYGTTYQYALDIKNNYMHNAVLINLDKASLDDIDINSYDQVIIGTSIYYGMISKQIKKFCMEKSDQLKHKKIGIFASCIQHDQFESVLQSQLSSELMNACIVKMPFTGELDTKKMKIYERIIVKLIIKTNPNQFKRDDQQVKHFMHYFIYR